MKCPNCGADMKEGYLYCEHCGEDIHIVPDFEPELEYNLENTLHGIVQEIHGEPIPQEKLQDWNTNEEIEDDFMQDWDEQGTASKAGFWKKFKLYFFSGLLILAMLLITIAVVLIHRHNSLDFQVSTAEKFVSEQEYDMAEEYYIRALELEPDSIELKFSLAEVFFQKNNKIEYEYLLREIVRDKNASAEQLESAYGKLIAIYSAREDYTTINELLMASGNESIISKYQNYIAVVPDFSVKEGSYTSIQPLKLTNFGTGKIYYTLDGTEPDENSMLYTAPILLEDGSYCVKACYINELGIVSDVVTKNYVIEIEELPPPEISAVSGDYQFPINIEILSEYSAIYYTKDGSTPDEHSSVYSGPIPMPLGSSTFKFIRIEDGRSSEVVERTYTLKMHTKYTPEQAVADVVQYSLDTGKILNEFGDFDETNSVYLYEFQYVTNINKVDDFYVVSEILSDDNQVLTKTGNHFALNAYTKELFKLQIDEFGNFNLVEIEKEAQ